MKKLVALIPTVYYHIIGRMLPGAAVLACLVFFPATRTVVLDSNGSYTWTVILVGGYAIGLILAASSALVFDVLLRLNAVQPHGEERKPLTLRIAAIGEKDSKVARRIWKMAAEKAFFENLFIGGVCLAVVDTYSLGLRPSAAVFWVCVLFGLYFISLERKHWLLVRLSKTENVLNLKKSFGREELQYGV
jgi:hypothetical protein